MNDPGPPTDRSPNMRRQRRAWSSRLPGIAAWLLAACWIGSPALAQPVAPKPAPFVMGVDTAPDSYFYKWLRLIYAEVFRRLDRPFQLESYALKRQGLQIEAGEIDGESNRAFGYGTSQPTLVRVEEPILELVLALHTGHPTLRLQRLEDLSSSELQVEYRRGILLCENALKPVVPVKRLSDVATTEQAVKKLLTQRTDVYCDFTVSLLMAHHTPELAGATGVRTLIQVGQPVPTYPYLHRKHAELAPRMAAVLKQMKTQGLIDAYRLQVERELGWGLQGTAR